MRALTTGDLIEATGWSKKQVGNLCDSGILLPVQDGSGRGRFRFFGFTQALGLAFARQLASRSGTTADLMRLLEAVMDHSETELLDHFAKGRTLLFPTATGPMKLVKKPADLDEDIAQLFDLERVYYKVKAVLEAMAKETTGAKLLRPIGRRRGLVSMK